MATDQGVRVGQPEGGALPVAPRRRREVEPAKPQTLSDRQRLAEVMARSSRGQATDDDVAFLLYLQKEMATRLAKVGKSRAHLRNTLAYIVGREAYEVIQNREAEARGYQASLRHSQKEVAELRRLLWATHGCLGKYGDDGELQCSACFIDFKRLPVAEIEARLQARGRRLLAAAATA